MKKVCIVGYGSIGPTHAEAIKDNKDIVFYAVCDIDAEAIKRCKAQHDVIAYTDYDEMLKDKSIDAVHICTPHFLHFEMIKKALESGKDVVCEKPVVMTSGEFEKLLCLKNSEKVCTVLQNRYNSCIQKLKQMIRNGELGDIVAVKGVVTWRRESAYYEESNWRGAWSTEGGSALINQFMHTLDMMLYLVGSVKDVQASLHNYTLQNVIETEDTVEAYMRFTNGAVGLFYASNNYVLDSAPDIEIVGTKLTVKYANKRLLVDGKYIMDDSMPSIGKQCWGNGHKALLEDYYKNNLFFSPHDIKNTMYTLYGIYESAHQNSRVIEIES